MNYELFNYRQIFDGATNSYLSDSTNIEELKSEIKTECGRILIALQNNIAHIDATKTTQYIHQHQQELHILLDELEKTTAESQKKAEIKKDRKKVSEVLKATTENLLIDLQRYFPAYFNYQSKPPYGIFEKTKEDIDHKASQIIKLLVSQGNEKQRIDNLEAMLYPILTSHKTITYHLKDYMETFLEMLAGRMETTGNGSGMMDLLLHMISLNYNHPLFYEYCCSYFNQEIEACEELSAQYSSLNFVKKRIKQTCFPDIQRYNLDLPPIQDSLLNYINSELEYLDSMNKIGSSLQRHGLLDDKYKVTLTVKQLAIFIHLQVEAKIIITETPKFLHEYISGHYSTGETDRISAKSFKNAYYSASTDDLEKVIDKIVTMLAVAQEKL